MTPPLAVLTIVVSDGTSERQVETTVNDLMMQVVILGEIVLAFPELVPRYTIPEWFGDLRAEFVCPLGELDTVVPKITLLVATTVVSLLR